MKKALVITIPIIVFALAVGAAFYFRIWEIMSPKQADLPRELPKIEAPAKKPASGYADIHTGVIPAPEEPGKTGTSTATVKPTVGPTPSSTSSDDPDSIQKDLDNLSKQY